MFKKYLYIRKIIFCLLTVVVFLSPENALTLTIQEGLRIINSKSKEIKISLKEEKITEQTIPLARSTLLPRLDLYINKTWLRYQPEASFGAIGSVPLSEKEFLTYGAEVKQLIYDFGRSYSILRSARLRLDAKRFDTEVMKNKVALKFILTYLDLLEAEKMLDVAKEEVKRRNAHLRDTKAMYEEGVITKNDLLQAEVMASDAKQRQIITKNFRDMAVSRLNSLLSRPLNKEITVKEIVHSPVIIDMSLEEAWKIAEEKRAELKVLKEQMMAKNAELKSVKAEFLPTLYVTGGYEYQENTYRVHEDNWSVVAGINLNLFTGGAKRARLNSIKRELEKIKLQMEKLIDSIRLEVKSEYLDIASSKERVKVTEKSVKQAQENLRLQRLRYKEGVGTATDVTDAITLLRKAETNYFKAVYNLRRAEARFLYALGYNLIKSYGGSDE